MNKRTSPFTILLFFLLVILFGFGITAGISLTRENALPILTRVTAMTAAVSFIFALATGDFSWTDRLWSISPIAYAAVYAGADKFSPQTVLPLLLISLWGIRLTFNFARRGGYSGEQDYRWKILQEKISNSFIWLVFNLLFIALYQQILFLLFTLPLHTIVINNSSVTYFSAVCALAAFLFLLLETIADQQQYTFQQAKNGSLPRCDALSQDYARGFRTTGLFRVSRHPNYLGELGFWWCIYFLSASMTGTLINYSISGVSLLTLLFAGSTVFTEAITSSKYREYAAYKERVWPIIPRLWPCSRSSKSCRS